MKPTTIDEYIAVAPEQARTYLTQIRALLRKLAPNATEAIKWGNPVFEEKRILFAFTAFKKHINFMPTAASLAPFAKELEGYTIGKGTVQLPYDKPLPLDLIRKLAEHRIHDVRENDARWM